MVIEMKYRIEANLELRELNKLVNLPEDVYDFASIIIDHLSDTHEHMKIHEFVDMCINLAIVDLPEFIQARNQFEKENG